MHNGSPVVLKACFYIYLGYTNNEFDSVELKKPFNYI